MKRRGMLIAAPAALALPALRSVAQGLDAVPAPGPTRPIAVPPIEGFVLPNGMRAMIAVRRGVPLVTAQVLVLAGQEADGPGRAGLGAALATLLTKGARRDGKNVDAATLARQAEALGGGLESGAGWRSTALGMTVTTPKLPAALALLADATQRPLLQAEELDRARLQALDGLKLALEQPGSVAEMAARRANWGAGVYGQVTTPATLQRLAVDELRRHHALHWRPDRAVLVLAGDIDAAGARPLAEAVFGGWARPEVAPPLSSGTAPEPTLPPVLWVDLPGSGQSAVLVSAPTVPQGHADGRIAEVAHTLLGGGYSSRLNQAIRIERGLSYGAFGGAEQHPVAGLWQGQAQTKHASAAEVAGLMREALLRIAREPAPAAELEARKAALVGGFAQRLQTSNGLAGLVSAVVAQGRDPAELAARVEQIRAVTPAQVQAFAARWWKPEAFRTTIAGDWAAAGDSVKALGEGLLRIPKAKLDLDREGLQAG